MPPKSVKKKTVNKRSTTNSRDIQEIPIVQRQKGNHEDVSYHSSEEDEFIRNKPSSNSQAEVSCDESISTSHWTKFSTNLLKSE